jgi:5-hydroxyisourate hydrolase
VSLSTHVLDAGLGRPASGVAVRLERDGTCLAEDRTDADGRIARLAADLPVGEYRITFDTGGYFAATGQHGFYPEVVVVFGVSDAARHHHVPLLLSPFAYSTYLGS